MLTEQELSSLTDGQLQAVLWADSYLWPAAQDYFEEWLVAEPGVAVPSFEQDPWQAFKKAHDWDQARQRKAKEQEAARTKTKPPRKKRQK